MNFENEVDYRLAKMLLSNMCQDGILTEQKKDKLWQTVFDYFNPPFGSVEDINGNIGEGFRLSEIRERRAKKNG